MNSPLACIRCLIGWNPGCTRPEIEPESLCYRPTLQTRVLEVVSSLHGQCYVGVRLVARHCLQACRGIVGSNHVRPMSQLRKEARSDSRFTLVNDEITIILGHHEPPCQVTADFAIATFGHSTISLIELTSRDTDKGCLFTWGDSFVLVAKGPCKEERCAAAPHIPARAHESPKPSQLQVAELGHIQCIKAISCGH